MNDPLPPKPQPFGRPSTGKDAVADLRVCHIISSFRPVVGGAERVTETVCRGLRDRGLDVTLLTRRYPGTEAGSIYEGLVVRRLGTASRRKLGALTFGLQALWELATSLRDYSIVHTSTYTPLLVGLLAKLVLGRDLVVTIHTDPNVLFGTARRTGTFRLRLVNLLADRVVALTPLIRDRLEEQGLDADRVVVLPNAVDTRRYSPPDRQDRRRARSAIGVNEDELVYIFVGRLEPVKGVDLLLRAWAPLEPRGRRLVLVGDGPEGDGLRRLSVELGIVNVEFAGATDRTDRFLEAGDVFVLPSRREGQSVALLEAMATGLPAVASDVGGNRSLINDGENGLLFKAGDVQGLSRHLSAVEEGKLRRRLGRKAAALVRREYSAQASASRHLELYREVARTGQRRPDAELLSAERSSRRHEAERADT